MQFFALIALVFITSFNVLWSSALAATITLSSVGGGRFTLQGENMDGVSGMQFTVGYDNQLLALPTVTPGSLVNGALLSANTAISSSVKIAIVKPSPFFGSGEIAAISFSTFNGTGGITTISAQLIDTHGANLPVQTAILAGASTNPITPITPQSTAPSSTSPISQPPTNTVTNTTSTSGTGTTVLGTVTLPSDAQPKSEPKPQEDSPAKLPPLETEIPSADVAPRKREATEEQPAASVKVSEPKQVSYASVLDRFKKFDGQRTPSAMMALFASSVAPELRQDPVVSIADGKSSFRVYVKLPKEAATPSLTLSGSSLVSMDRDAETGELVLDVLPTNNGATASVTIMTEQTIATFPLTTVPLVADVATEAAFAAFLKDNGAKKPKFDLNGDGVHDYRDDYIYTGNYLIKKAAKQSKPS